MASAVLNEFAINREHWVYKDMRTADPIGGFVRRGFAR